MNAAPPPRKHEATAAFERQYATYQYHVVEFLVEHLGDVSKAFRGDLQAVLVLALVGQMALQRRPENGGLGLNGDGSISASRIADITGIPRQTVRRKLAVLATCGWIEKTPSASYRLIAEGESSPARRDLADVDRRAIDRVARLYCSLERLLAAPGSGGR